MSETGKLKIGVSNNDQDHPIVGKLINSLSIFYENKVDLFYGNDILEMLTEGALALALVRMDLLPINYPKNLSIGALSQRSSERLMWVFNKSKTDSTKILALSEGSIFITNSEIIGKQIQSIREDLFFEIRNNDEAIELLKNEIAYAMVLPELDLHKIQDFKHLEYKYLHPTEVIPPAASGVYGFICKSENIELRKILLRIHNNEVSNMTNVERKVMKLMSHDTADNISVHCQRDGNGFYHIKAAICQDHILSIQKISSSTTYLLPETLVESFIEKTIQNN